MTPDTTATSVYQRKPVVALMVDFAPPWLTSCFNAAARLMDLVAVETVAEHPARGTGAGRIKIEQFRRHTVFERAMNDPDNSREFVRSVAKSLGSLGPDVVVTMGWTLPRDLAALLWAINNGVPTVIVVDSNEHDFPRTAWKEGVKGWLLSRCSVGWAAGTSSARYLARLGMPSERIVKGNLENVDVDHFRAGADAARSNPNYVRRSLGLPHNYFLSVSRFAPEKNLLRLAEAYALYHSRAGKEAWHFVIVGDGSMRNELDQVIQQQRLQNVVWLPGWRSFEQVPQYYGLAGAFILASTREPWGSVVNEAMAAGLPILVSSRCGSAQDLVEEGRNGFSFDPHNPARIAEVMWKLAHGPCDLEAMGRASREIGAQMCPDRYADSLLDAVNTALSLPARKTRLWDRLLLTALIRKRIRALDNPVRRPVGDDAPHDFTILNCAATAHAGSALPKISFFLVMICRMGNQGGQRRKMAPRAFTSHYAAISDSRRHRSGALSDCCIQKTEVRERRR